MEIKEAVARFYATEREKKRLKESGAIVKCTKEDLLEWWRKSLNRYKLKDLEKLLGSVRIADIDPAKTWKAERSICLETPWHGAASEQLLESEGCLISGPIGHNRVLRQDGTAEVGDPELPRQIAKELLEEWARGEVVGIYELFCDRQREGETDWARVRAMTEDDIDAAALADPDAQPTSFEDWEDAVLTPPMTFLGDGKKGDKQINQHRSFNFRDHGHNV